MAILKGEEGKLRVFLIVTDLHASYRNKENRYDYLSEIEFVIDKIFETASKYASAGYEVNIIFLGDITDNSFKDQNKAIYLNNIFVLLKRIANIYSVLGNHEMSFYKDNPFWSLMNKMPSEKVRAVINRSWQPTGLIQLVDVVDTLDLGETVLHFNHHATDISRPIEGKYNIGLFHKDVVSRAVIDSVKATDNSEIFEANPIYIENNPEVLRGYDVCYFGHMHKIYGEWAYVDEVTNKEVTLRYLGSLGRPNQTEVNDRTLERDLAAIIVDSEGRIVSRDSNLITLPDRKSCVKEEVVAVQQANYEIKKERKYFLDYVSVDDNPVENIKSAVSQYGEALTFFEDYLTEDIPQFERELMRALEEVRYF